MYDSTRALEIAFKRETIPTVLGTLIIFTGFVWAAMFGYYPMGFIIMISVVCVSIWYQRNYFLIESIKERNVSQNEVQLFSVGVSLLWWLGSSSILYCLIGDVDTTLLVTVHLSSESMPFTRRPFVLLVLRIISLLSMVRTFPNVWNWMVNEIEHIDDLNVIYHRHPYKPLDPAYANYARNTRK